MRTLPQVPLEGSSPPLLRYFISTQMVTYENAWEHYATWKCNVPRSSVLSMSTNQSFLQAMKSHVGKRVLTSYSLDVGHYYYYYFFWRSKFLYFLGRLGLIGTFTMGTETVSPAFTADVLALTSTTLSWKGKCFLWKRHNVIPITQIF